MANIKSIYGNPVVDDSLRKSVAAEYSSSATYAVGDYCLHNGQLYECNTAISTAEAWTAAHWTAVTVGKEISGLKGDLGELYAPITVSDMYGANASVAGKDNAKISGTWDSTTKTVSVTMSDSATSADTYYIMLAPKFTSGHTYKIVIEYDYPKDAYTYIRNVYSLTNINQRDDIVNGTIKSDGDKDVYTLTATSDGWLSLGKRVGANITHNWAFKVAAYDVTGLDVSEITDATWKTFSNNVAIGIGGLIGDIQGNVEFLEAVATNVKGETWSALGDSLTAAGSGSQYLGYVKDRLGLANYYNCGIGGTTISGATNQNAMYQDVRVETLNIASNCVTVLGGTNDAWQEYYKDHPSENLTGWGDCVRTNHDVSTFCGAYNVLISKILYKFCKVTGYYTDVDYTGITQVDTAIDNFRLILLTPPQAFHVDGDTMSASLQISGLTAAHSYVKQIAELWGLPCVDTWEMGMNDINRSLFFANYLTDATHFNAFGHERLASLLIDKAIQVARYK